MNLKLWLYTIDDWVNSEFLGLVFIFLDYRVIYFEYLLVFGGIFVAEVCQIEVTISV